MHLPTPEELAWLRSGALPPAIAARAAVLLQTPEWQPRAGYLQQDLATGRVVAVDGRTYFTQELFQRSEYRFDSAPNVYFADTVVQRPLPGRHRLYLLPQTGVVVGHESPDDLVSAYRAQLLRAVELSADDLASLRERRSTPAVRAKIARGARKLRILAWFVGALFVVPIGLGALDGMRSPWFELFDIPFGWPVLLTPIVPLASIAAHREASRLAREEHAAIEIVEGVADVRTIGSGKSRHRCIEIGGELFHGNQQLDVERLHDVVSPGWPCRGYVTAGLRTLLAMEPLPT